MLHSRTAPSLNYLPLSDCPATLFLVHRTRVDSACSICPTAINYGASECVGCDPGQYKLDGTKNTLDKDEDCDVCPLGKFTDERDVDSCKICLQ